MTGTGRVLVLHVGGTIGMVASPQGYRPAPGFPERLRQALPFHLTSSMDFSMKLRCEHAAGSGCGIRNAADDVVVPVDVDVTIPGMRNLKDGRPAQDTPLSADDALAPLVAALTISPGIRFILGLPMNSATNRLVGCSYRAIGAPTCSITPPFSTTMRSARVMAST